MDIREFEDTLCDGRHLSVKPDVIGDFRNIPFNMENYLTLGHKISNKDLMNV